MNPIQTQIAQDMANKTGKIFHVYLSERVWHTVQEGLKETPKDAQHFQIVTPTEPMPTPEPRDSRLGKPIWAIW